MKSHKRVAKAVLLADKYKKDLAPWNGQKEVERKPIIRLLCMHGVADSYNQMWHTFQAEAPSFVEVAVHEFPGHGHRESENVYLETLDDLVNDAFETFKDAMDTGSFALLGHSIGCGIATGVARRARAELGVEPVLAIMVERGALPFPKWNEFGIQQLRDEPLRFMEHMQPKCANLFKHAPEDMGKRTMNMWQKGWFVEADTREVGWHTFRCPILAIYADRMTTVGVFVDLDNAPEEMKQFLKAQLSVQYNAEQLEDGTYFGGHFPLKTYHEWGKWTDNSAGVKVVGISNADHESIKDRTTFRTTVWDALKNIVKDW